MDQIQKGDQTEEELMIIIAHKDQGQLNSSRVIWLLPILQKEEGQDEK